MSALVRLDRVTKDFTEGQVTRHVLREADLAVSQGSFVAIRGRSGSGKSTVLNLVAGIDRPTAGDVYVGDTCMTRLSPRDRTLYRRDHMGFVFQFFNLIPTLTVLENVLLPAELGGDTAAQARASDLLERVGLRIAEIPSRTACRAASSSASPSHVPSSATRAIVLADEPTGNLDDATGVAVMELLEAVTRRAGKTLLLVTHSREVAALADQVFTIEDGRLVAQAAP